MTTHTPGPWKYTRGANPKYNVVDIPHLNGQPGTGQALYVDRAANARLIAAAPDMLDALRALMALHSTLDPENVYHAEAIMIFNGVWSAARDAIRKATSE